MQSHVDIDRLMHVTVTFKKTAGPLFGPVPVLKFRNTLKRDKCAHLNCEIAEKVREEMQDSIAFHNLVAS
jgi:hypothetical protein